MWSLSRQRPYPNDVGYRGRCRGPARGKGQHRDRNAWHSRSVLYAPRPRHATSAHTEPWVSVRKEADMWRGYCGEFSRSLGHDQRTVAESNIEIQEKVSRRIPNEHHHAYGANEDKVKFDRKKMVKSLRHFSLSSVFNCSLPPYVK